MDLALPMPQPIDRRRLAALVLAGATSAVLAELGVPMTEDRRLTAIDSLQRTVSDLAARYDTAGPIRIASLIPQAEIKAAGIAADRSRLPAQNRDARVLYARLMTISANANGDIGNPRAAMQAASIAASVAIETKDFGTAAHAMCLTADLTTADRRALAQCAQAADFAPRGPAGVMASVTEAQVAARMGDVQRTLEAVRASEGKHERLPVAAWGNPGYSFGTYHPANLKMFTGAALVKAGMPREAEPRLEEAADLAHGTGLMPYILLNRARASLGTGDVGTAHGYAATAVDSAQTRPAAWVVTILHELDQKSGGSFVDLIEKTSRWGFATD